MMLVPILPTGFRKVISGKVSNLDSLKSLKVGLGKQEFCPLVRTIVALAAHEKFDLDGP